MKSGKIDMKKQISIKSKYYKDEADMFKKLNESLKNEIEHLKRDLEKYRKPSRVCTYKNTKHQIQFLLNLSTI